MECLEINKNEVLRYLGYRNQLLDDGISLLIDDCINEMRSLAESRYVYKFFVMDNESGKILLRDSNIELLGKDIFNHLRNSSKCILMAATLGSTVDMRIRYYEKINITRALILDACASTAIEEVCDNVCSEIDEKLAEQNEKLTSRFSPGYGDLPIDMQRNFITCLQADRAIGLTASSSNILIPGKSVTAIMGIIGRSQRREDRKCSNCNKYFNCQFKREEDCCGA